MRILAAILVATFSFGAFAADPSPALIFNYIEGRDYVALEKPVPTDDPRKIEVAEAFAYTCPHCAHFEPLIEAWAKKQPSDVALVQVHVSWGPAMEPYQRGYYTALNLKVKDKAQQDIFNHIHTQQKELKDAQAWVDFLSSYGVSKQAILAAYNSAAVTDQINKANERYKNYQISGTPELVVDGKYRASTRLTGSQEDMLKVAQFLINKVRVERAAKH